MVAQGCLWKGSGIHFVVSVFKAVGGGAGFVDVLLSKGLIMGMMMIRECGRNVRDDSSYLCLY